MEQKENEKVSSKLNEKHEKNRPSKIVLSNQNNLILNGISKVLSSTENEICVVINEQKFCANGQKLTVTKLDVESGILEATGIVTSMKFEGHKQKENFFKRIFK